MANFLEKFLMNDLASSAARAARLRTLREAFGLTQLAFCKKYGFKITRWNNFERGMPLGIKAAQQLCAQIPGLSLGWLYSGATGDLSIGMARLLGELPEPPSTNFKA